MPENLDFGLYFNIVFFSVIILGFVFGYLRGFRKSLYSLIVMAIFYVFFFVTIDAVVSALWSMNIPTLFDTVGAYVPEVAGSTSFEQAITSFLESSLPASMQSTMSNERFTEFVFGLGQFSLKIVYTILYFTVFQIIYRFFFFIIRILFFRAKTKGLGKGRLPGAFVGAAKGVMSAFVTLIVLGGMMSVMGSFLALVPSDDTTPSGGSQTADVDAYYLSGVYGTPLATPLPVADQDETLAQAGDMVDAFNNNIFVKAADSLKFSADGYPSEVSLHLYLFDTVMSFEYQEERIKFRKELVIFADLGRIFLDSDLANSGDITSVSGNDVRDAFNALSNSELFTSLMPLIIEVGSDYYDNDITIPVDELYAIDWQTEVAQLGEVIATGYELVDSAGLLDENPDLTTITLSGDDVEGLFDELANSEMMTLAAYVAISPLLESMSADLQSIITVPSDMDWDVEFRAFGDVAGAVLNTGITVADIESGDFNVILSELSALDLTVLLESEIMSHALKNIFSKDAQIDGLEMITVPSDVEWFDTYDGDVRTADGELRNILNAVNAIVDVAGGFEFSNISLDTIADFDTATIDTIFGSRLLVASISTYMLDMDLGNTPLIIPDSVLDTDGYILKAELVSLASSARVLVDEMSCDETDTSCEGFDVGKAFALEETTIDTLISSGILSATIGNLITDSGTDVITIPNRALETIQVDGVATEVVSSTEIKNMFLAIGVFGFDDISNIDFDPSIIQSLSLENDSTSLDTTKSAKLYASYILHATLSSIMIEQTEGTNAPLVVPYEDATSTAVRIYNATDDLDYVSTAELDALLDGIISLTITSFDDVSGLDLSNLLPKIAGLLDSATLHATISKQILDIDDETLFVPLQDQDSNAVRVTTGPAANQTEYVVKNEITAILDSLEVLGVTADIASFDGGFDLANLGNETAQNTVLSSASIHSTMSDLLLDLGSDVLIVPMYTEAGETAGNEVRVTVGSVEYVKKDEIKSILNAFDEMGFLDLENFGASIDSSQFFSNRTLLLESSSIHATLSDKLLNDTAGALVVPDDVRAVQTDVTYVTLAEINALMDGLDQFGLTDFTTLDFGPSNIFSADFSIVVASESLQATVSENILASATTESATVSATLIVPTVSRENITVDSVTQEQIESAELENLLDALKVLDVGAFDGAVDGGIITDMDDTQKDTMLASTSMHVTISNMMKDAFTTEIPDLAKATVYTITEIVIKDEIKDFINSAKVFGATDFTTVSFDAQTIANKTPQEQETILVSMTVRNILTPALENIATNHPTYSLDNTDYENNDPSTFLTKIAAGEVIDLLP